MLPNERNDLLYLLNILEYIGKIWKYTRGVKDAENLFELNEQMNLNASLTLLVNIGESVSKITEGLKQEYPNQAVDFIFFDTTFPPSHFCQSIFRLIILEYPLTLLLLT